MALAEDGSAATIGLITLTNNPGTTIISTIKYSPAGKELRKASFSLTNAIVDFSSLVVLADRSGGYTAAASYDGTSGKPKVLVVRYAADGSQQAAFEIDNCGSHLASMDSEGNLVLAGRVSYFNGGQSSLGYLWARVDLSGEVLARGGIIDADIIKMDSKDHLVFAGQRDYHTRFESLKGAYLRKTSTRGGGLSVPNVFVFEVKPTSVRQPTNIYLQAFVSGVNDNYRVDFYAGTNLIGSAANPADSSPAFFGTRYFHVWTNAPAGNHGIRAIAVHSSGISNASPRFTITVLSNESPLVRITSPTNGSIFSGNEPIKIHGTAFDPVDRLRKIELFEGPTWIGALSTNLTNFSFVFPDLGSGSYSVQAVATDENGAKGFSEPIFFQVGTLAPSQEPFRGAPISIPGLIQAEDFDEGGHQASHFNPIRSTGTSAYRTNISVEIRPHSPSSSSLKDYYVDGIRSGGWLEYTIDVAESGPYFVEIRHASESALNLSLELDRQPLLASYEGDYGFGLGQWRLGIKEGIFLPEGRHILRLVAVHSDANPNRNSQIDFIRIYQSPTRIYLDDSRITVLQHGDYGKPLVVEASTNLVNWLSIQTNLNWFGLPIFSDFQANQFDKRFFRIRRSPE